MARQRDKILLAILVIFHTLSCTKVVLWRGSESYRWETQMNLFRVQIEQTFIAMNYRKVMSDVGKTEAIVSILMYSLSFPFPAGAAVPNIGALYPDGRLQQRRGI